MGAFPLVSMDMLEEQGIAGPGEGQGSRAVLVGSEEESEGEQPPQA